VKKRAYLIASAVVALAVGVYAAIALGRFTASVVLLSLCAVCFSWVAWLLAKLARALVKEPEGVELKVATGRRRKQLEREKQMVIKALKELEFDHQMGKVSEADFREIGDQYRKRAMRAMRQLDLIEADTDYRKLVERDLATHTKKEPPQEAPKPAKPTCAACGTHNDGDAEFCKKCGKPLKAAAV
jgi:membrane protein implicated in regulation of membrane protease activity